MYHWFKPSGAGSCSLNVALVTLALLLVVCCAMVALQPWGGTARSGSIFPSSVVGLYAMYLCFSALQVGGGHVLRVWRVLCCVLWPACDVGGLGCGTRPCVSKQLGCRPAGCQGNGWLTVVTYEDVLVWL